MYTYIIYISFYIFLHTHAFSIRNDRISEIPKSIHRSRVVFGAFPPEVKIGKILIDQVGKDKWGTPTEFLGGCGDWWSGFFSFFLNFLNDVFFFGWSLKLRKQQKLQKLVPDPIWKKNRREEKVHRQVRSGIFFRWPCQYPTNFPNPCSYPPNICTISSSQCHHRFGPPAIS